MNGTTVTVLKSRLKSHSSSNIGTVTFVVVSCSLVFTWFMYSVHLSLFGHYVCMDGKADVNQILWARAREMEETAGQLHSTWLKNVTDGPTSCSIRLHDARDAANHSGGCWLELDDSHKFPMSDVSHIYVKKLQCLIAILMFTAVIFCKVYVCFVSFLIDVTAIKHVITILHLFVCVYKCKVHFVTLII